MSADRWITSCIAVLTLLTLCDTAQSSTYRIDSDYSSVSLSGFGASIGAFTRVSGTLTYDPANVDRSLVTFAIPIKSLDVLADGQAVHMGGATFVDVGVYPDITFKSTRVIPWGNVLHVSGTLSFLGVTRDVMLPVEIMGRGVHPKSGHPIAGFSAQLKVKLSDYGVDSWIQAAGILGDNISLRIQVVGVRDNNLSYHTP